MEWNVKWATTGEGRHKHPQQEAAAAEDFLKTSAAPNFDEFIVLKFIASNMPPYDFRWLNDKTTELDYGAVLVRVSQRYEATYGRR
jgi:hypothetical protein